ncbi:hypothetical protein DS2_02018 [Catenovulum agarivorans DS-2]|uniref:Uncharacterized protein n=1 Tax=Catenovulum agarivorans DS-2 TaxID=1328313 RepID=W7QJ58_9ALTE|nr:hypothetical protein [Catenovulum agarivorans]EWH11921.1 hypothetical protein DS2_02018 [Catenovulum agarivorans DS-2]
MEQSDRELSTDCFRAETARLLSLSVAQIHLGLSDGDASIGKVIEFCSEVANQCEAIQASMGHEEAAQATEAMHQQIKKAIIALQFYDRLSQRLAHVSSGLEELAELLAMEEHIKKAASWSNLRTKLVEQYCLVDEKEVYDYIMQGASVQQAIELMQKQKAQQNQQQDDETDITLF